MSRNYLLSAAVLIPVMLMVGVAVSWFYLWQPTSAEAQLGRSKTVSMSVGLTGIVDPKTKALPEQKIHDMSLVYSDGD